MFSIRCAFVLTTTSELENDTKDENKLRHIANQVDKSFASVQTRTGP